MTVYRRGYGKVAILHRFMAISPKRWSYLVIYLYDLRPGSLARKYRETIMGRFTFANNAY